MMPTIHAFMTRAPYCVTPTETLERARKLMDRHAIRHLPVVEGNEVVGVVLDREFVVIEAIAGLQPRSVLVARAMRPALSVSANLSLDEAVNLMIEHALDCLVVRGGTGLVEGIFTAVDALAAIKAVSQAAVPQAPGSARSARPSPPPSP